MADNQGVPKEFSDAIGAVCDMVTMADLEAMRTSGKGIQFLTNICEHGGNTLAAYDMVLKYLLVPYLPIWNAYLKFNKPISPISLE